MIPCVVFVCLYIYNVCIVACLCGVVYVRVWLFFCVHRVVCSYLNWFHGLSCLVCCAVFACSYLC